MSSYDNNLEKNKANYIPLTPLSFLKRAKEVYPNYEAIVYEDIKYTWDDVYKRAVKFASALEKIGISKGIHLKLVLVQIIFPYQVIWVLMESQELQQEPLVNI